MQRKCVCGNYIAGKRHICPACERVYGERVDWPEWLRVQVNDVEREYREQIEIDKREVLFSDLEFGDEDDCEDELDNGDDVLDSLWPFDHLIGCRTETHLYEDRDKYPQSEGLINSYKKNK